MNFEILPYRNYIRLFRHILSDYKLYLCMLLSVRLQRFKKFCEFIFDFLGKILMYLTLCFLRFLTFPRKITTMITMAYPIRRSRVISSAVSWIWSSGLYADPTPSSSSKFFEFKWFKIIIIVRYIDLDHRSTIWKK